MLSVVVVLSLVRRSPRWQSSRFLSYNEYLVAAVMLRREELYTVPTGIQQFIQQYATDLDSLMAAATMASLPTYVLFLLSQRYMLYGAIGSAVSRKRLARCSRVAVHGGGGKLGHYGSELLVHGRDVVNLGLTSRAVVPTPRGRLTDPDGIQLKLQKGGRGDRSSSQRPSLTDLVRGEPLLTVVDSRLSWACDVDPSADSLAGR